MKRRAYFMAAAMATAFCFTAFAAESNDTENHVPQDVFNGMRESFRPEKAHGVHARYQWELCGPNGGEWWVELNDGKFTMGRGKIDNPDVTFVASDKTWVAISNGKLKGTWAVLTGRLKVRGSQAVARKLDDVFP